MLEIHRKKDRKLGLFSVAGLALIASALLSSCAPASPTVVPYQKQYPPIPVPISASVKSEYAHVSELNATQFDNFQTDKSVNYIVNYATSDIDPEAVKEIVEHLENQAEQKREIPYDNHKTGNKNIKTTLTPLLRNNHNHIFVFLPKDAKRILFADGVTKPNPKLDTTMTFVWLSDGLETPEEKKIFADLSEYVAKTTSVEICQAVLLISQPTFTNLPQSDANELYCNYLGLIIGAKNAKKSLGFPEMLSILKRLSLALPASGSQPMMLLDENEYNELPKIKPLIK